LYFVGEFDGVQFSTASGPKWLDFGPDNYAASTWETETGRIQIGWMNNWRYAREIPPAAGRSRGSMTLPRHLELVDMPGQGPLIRQIPVIPPSRQPVTARSISLEAERTGYLGIIPCRSCQQISVDGTGADECDFQATFRWTFACGAVLELTWNSNGTGLSVDRSRCGQTAFHGSFAGRFDIPLNKQADRFEAVILFDNTSMEVFAENGTSVASFLIFPASTDQGMTLECQSGAAKFTASATWWEIAV
jgi:fructan beta-fructosidase